MKSGVIAALQRARHSLKRQGIITSFRKVIIVYLDLFFDVKYGTDTCTFSKLDQLTIESDNVERGIDYLPTRVIPLRKLFNIIESKTPPESVIIDFGCGKARVLLMASQYNCFKAARGVEFAHELCVIAQSNFALFKQKSNVTADFEIIEGDVVDYHIRPDENIFYMSNPFDGVVMGKIINNITESLKVHPRKILIIYYYPIHGELIEMHFKKVEEFYFWGYQFNVYSN
jgi:hypothetical protein